jgi:hypothetical protein
MNPSRTILFLAALSTAVTSWAQPSAGKQTAQTVFSPVPFWTAGGPPTDLADKYFVYFDYNPQQYVVSYPESLQTGRKEDRRRVEFRIEPQNKVEPQISVTITKGAADQYLYRYQLANGNGAKQPIRYFMIVAASDDESLVLKHSEWTAYVAPTRNVAPQAALAGVPPLKLHSNNGKYASWYKATGTALMPGVRMDGLEATSSFLPGITTSYARQGDAPRFPGDLPTEVSDQLAPVMGLEHDSKVTATIGPKFDRTNGPSADPIWIADDYGNSIASLVESGRLQAESPFIQELNSILRAIIDTGARRAIQFKAQPATPFENEIAVAVKIALGLE